MCVCFYFLLLTFLTDVIRRFVYNTSLSVHSARFNCRGNERSLLDCEIQSSYCSRYSAGHVTCLSKFIELFSVNYFIWLTLALCNEPETNLIGSNGLPLDNPTISTNPTLVGGIVEFCVKGMRNVICDNSWSHFDAMVGCRGLGYSPYGNILLRSDTIIINI